MQMFWMKPRNTSANTKMNLSFTHCNNLCTKNLTPDLKDPQGMGPRGDVIVEADWYR